MTRGFVTGAPLGSYSTHCFFRLSLSLSREIYCPLLDRSESPAGQANVQQRSPLGEIAMQFPR